MRQADFFRNARIIARKHVRTLSKNNKNLPVGENEYTEMPENQKKEQIKEIRKNLITYKIGNVFIALSIVSAIACLIFVIKIINSVISFDALSLSHILLFITPPTISLLSLIAAFGLRNGGPLSVIYSIINSKIAIEDDKFIYSYDSLDPGFTENFTLANHITQTIHYNQINRITYCERLRKYTIYGNFTYRQYFLYDENNPESKERYSDNKKVDDKIEIYDFFENKELFNIIAQKSFVEIENTNNKEITRPINYALMLLFYIFLVSVSPITLIFINADIEKPVVPNFETEELQIYEEDAEIDFDDSDYKKTEDIIFSDLGNDATIRYLTNQITSETLANGEKVKKITAVAYNNESDRVYCYIFYKYQTRSTEHSMGDIELFTSFTSSMTKDEIM